MTHNFCAIVMARSGIVLSGSRLLLLRSPFPPKVLLMGILEKIPTFLTVSVLLMIFVCLKRHARCARLTFWAIGWTLVFIHFLAELLEPASGTVPHSVVAVELGSLQAAGIAFLISLSSVVEDRARRLLLFAVLAVPSVAYLALRGYETHARWPYIFCLCATFAAAASFAFRVQKRITPFLFAMALLCTAAAAWAIGAAVHHSFDEGSAVLLGLAFALPGIFLCRNHWRLSPAMLTICGGFLSWGAVFPIGLIVERFAPHAIIPGELWSMPKLFVAFGMILAIVEDKSHSIAAMQDKAEALNVQLRRFASITSQLLSGAKAESICPEIALAITDVNNFSSAVIYLEDSDRRLKLISACPRLREWSLSDKVRQWTTDDVKQFCSQARRIGQNSFLITSEDDTTEMLIPLRSAGGGYLGCIKIESALKVQEIRQDELSPIESLAADLAVAVEIKALHRQLVWSEKLAALGQLVAGVAHELNNPLAVIMGYSELLTDTVTSSRERDQLEKVINESRRMKRIIENLLRFSRQSSRESSASQLAPVLQEILALRDYSLRTRNVQVETELSSNLPSVAINEDEMKQILLNLLNNSSDALESGSHEKRIRIRASQSGHCALIVVEDSGPGFANLNRALDPFYTTKPVGKGTGLGLSVCYGIVKERGGDLRIENVEPHGARVVIELPLAQAVPTMVLAAAAHA